MRFTQLNFVDLAGHSQLDVQVVPSDKQKEESLHINSSLSLLKNLVVQLSGFSHAQRYITFEKCNLTKLFEMFFFGNSQTGSTN